MKDLISCIEQLRIKLDRHRKDDLKEYPTRTIFIDPLLKALGWDVRDPDDVQLEYPTIDGKSVDYAPMLNKKPILFIEAKALNDSLTDVKSITQVVGYAANAGVEWCVLTNGITYKMYHSTEKAEAPDKLLFEVTIDAKEAKGKSVQQIAEQFARFSKDSMAQGALDAIGEQVFTMGKVRKALDKIFFDPPSNLVKLVRNAIADNSIKPTQIKSLLRTIWVQTSDIGGSSHAKAVVGKFSKPASEKKKRGGNYGEAHHVTAKPQEVLELYRSLDKFCRELNPQAVERKYLAKYVAYVVGKSTFCSVHVQKSGLRVWLKLNYSKVQDAPSFARDVSKIGHWGVGGFELDIDNHQHLETTKSFVRRSFEANRT